MNFENKEIMNDDENKCPNCGSYYTEEIHIHTYPKDSLVNEALDSSGISSEKKSFALGASYVIFGIVFTIWILNVIIAIIPLLGILVREYLPMNTFYLVVSLLFALFIEQVENKNIDKNKEKVSLKKNKIQIKNEDLYN